MRKAGNTVNQDPQARWDTFALAADAHKIDGVEPRVGRPADVRKGAISRFRPRNVAPVTVISGREVYDGLHDIGPVRGDGGVGRDDEMLAFVHPEEAVEATPVGQAVTSKEAIVIPVDLAGGDTPSVIPVNIRLV